MKKETNVSAIKTVDTVSAENIIAASEIKAVTAVNKNYESGVYSWYRKSFKTKAKAFKYLWNKRGSYKGTTNFIFQIEIDGEKVFNWDSAAKDYALEISDEEIQKLYEEAEIKEEAKSVIAESKNYVKFSKEFPKEFEAMLQRAEGNRREAKMRILARKLKKMSEEIDAREEAMLEGVVSEEAQEAAIEAEEENAASETMMLKSDITDAAMAEVEKAHEVSTAELEYLLKGYEAEIETQKAAMKESVRKIKYYQNAIIEYMASIMKAEDYIAEYGVEMMDAKAKIEWLEEETAKIKAEILNRNFNASALMTAVMTEKVPAFATVTFDLQQFNEVVIAESAATIDTAVSKTEIPYIDEDAADEEFDAETKKLADEIEDYDMDIANIDERIEKLQEEIRKLESLRYGKYKERNKVEGENRSRAKKLHEWACATVKFGDKEIVLKGRNKKIDRINGEESFEDGFAISIESNGAIRCYLWRSNIKLAEYHTVKDFKAAIRELAAAIERGDKEFTFPANK